MNGLISSSELTRPSDLFRLTAVARGEFFAALFLIACVNGLLLACCVASRSYFRTASIPFVTAISLVGIPFIAIVALPVAGSSWLGVTGLALYIITCTERLSRRLRGTIILLATSFSMFWTKQLVSRLSQRYPGLVVAGSRRRSAL